MFSLFLYACVVEPFRPLPAAVTAQIYIRPPTLIRPLEESDQNCYLFLILIYTHVGTPMDSWYCYYRPFYTMGCHTFSERCDQLTKTFSCFVYVNCQGGHLVKQYTLWGECRTRLECSAGPPIYNLQILCGSPETPPE